MSRLVLVSPLRGWSLPLTEVPDPVFAERMAGDGVGIDPTGSVLHAPCDGEIVPMQGAKHALTLRTAAGADLLLHLGIDTVQLGGEGFEPLVRAGERVTAGQELLRFDLDLIARRARSAVTPVLLASEGIIRRRSENCAVEIGDFLMEIEVGAVARELVAAERPQALSRHFQVPFDHGVHARPAALIAAALRPFGAEVVLISRGRQSNARSAVAMMALGVARGETIELRAVGADAAHALAALEPLLAPVATVAPVAVTAVTTARVAANLPRQLEAVIASRGIAVGLAVQLTLPDIAVNETGTGEAKERQALQTAVAVVKERLEATAMAAGGEQQSILVAHVELLQDPELARQAHDWIAQGKSAGYGWRAATRAMIAALHALDDRRMGERAADLRDIEDQVLRVLGGHAAQAHRELPDRTILLADELLPSQLMAVDRSRVVGFCSARGGPTSHVAIIATSMGIPALVAAGSAILQIAEGTSLVLNAELGRLDIDPAAEVLRAVEQSLAARGAQQAADLQTAKQACRTTDQIPIAVFANLGTLREAAPAIAFGAEGCGLLRTEFLFQERREPPDEDEQLREYQAIADALAGRPLTLRTLDIGGDKPIDYLPLPHEDNPALGLRGLRTSLWRPDLLRTQLRAMLRVPPPAQCRILLPMVTDLDDVRTVRALLKEISRELGLAALPALGIMIETPASALLADQLAREVDFLSIGSNDLSQYTLAMDRGHPELAARLDGLHPAVLRLIAGTAAAGHGHGKEVAVCGGLASDPVAVPILIGLGIRELSAVPASIPRIKGLIRTLDSGACRELAARALEQATAGAVRRLVESWQRKMVSQETVEAGA